MHTLDTLIRNLNHFRDQFGGDKQVFISNYDQQNISWAVPSKGCVMTVEKDKMDCINILLKME